MIKIILLFTLIFLLSLQVISDTDFGWHMRTGEYIVSTKTIPKTDIFSFSNPGYPYVYHSWASEVLMYLSYKTLGAVGATIFYATILTTSIFILYKINCFFLQKNNFSSEPSLLFFLAITPIAYSVAGGRTRVFGLLFLALIYYFFLKSSHSKSRLGLLIPAIFLLWANFHASFVLGIIALFMIFIAEIIFEKNKKAKRLLPILPLSIAATLANPYFINSWKQALLMFLNSYLIKDINPDWQPLINLKNSGWIVAALAMGLILAIIFLKIKIGGLQKILLFTSLILSLISSRFAILLLVFSISPAAQTIAHLKNKLKKELPMLPIITSITALTLVLFLLIAKNLFEINYAYKSMQNYSEFLKTRSQYKNKQYAWPYQGSEFIKNNLEEKRILTEANWASFMLILDKDFKVFYYGAMDNFFVNGKSFAFEYLRLVYAQPGFQDRLEKYDIEVVFLPDSIPLTKELKKSPNWKTAYKDESATVLVKN